jgi:hypothetical protein
MVCPRLTNGPNLCCRNVTAHHCRDVQDEEDEGLAAIPLDQDMDAGLSGYPNILIFFLT